MGYDCELEKLSCRINEMIRRGNHQIFVACECDKVVGFIGGVSFLAFEIENECLKIPALAVSEEYRHQGIGTNLIKSVEDYTNKNNIGVILVNSGLHREKAHKFYESQGYFKKSYGFVKKL